MSNGTVLPLKNVQRLLNVAEMLIDDTMSAERLGVFHGPSGWGKSFAATFTQNSYINTIHLEIQQIWDKRTFLDSLAKELSIVCKPNEPPAQMAEKILQKLKGNAGILILDDAQFLSKRYQLPYVQYFLNAGQPVILIGEEDLPKRLEGTPRLYGRVSQWEQAAPADAEDVQHLAEIYCKEISLDDALIEAIEAHAAGSLRYIGHILKALDNKAKTHRVPRLGADAIDHVYEVRVAGAEPRPPMKSKRKRQSYSHTDYYPKVNAS